MDKDNILEPQKGDPYYEIDTDERVIRTDYQGIQSTTPFDKAFAHAISCQEYIDSGELPNVQENLFLAVYRRYLKMAGNNNDAPILK